MNVNDYHSLPVITLTCYWFVSHSLGFIACYSLTSRLNVECDSQLHLFTALRHNYPVTSYWMKIRNKKWSNQDLAELQPYVLKSQGVKQFIQVFTLITLVKQISKIVFPSIVFFNLVTKFSSSQTYGYGQTPLWDLIQQPLVYQATTLPTVLLSNRHLDENVSISSMYLSI